LFLVAFGFRKLFDLALLLVTELLGLRRCSLKLPRLPHLAFRFLEFFSSPLGVLRDLKSLNPLGALRLLRYPTGLLPLKLFKLPRKSRMHRYDCFSPFSWLTPR
jgi:hypothetical protein